MIHGLTLLGFGAARVAALVFARDLAAFWFAPCFGAVASSKFLRIAAALTLTFLLFPIAAPGAVSCEYFSGSFTFETACGLAAELAAEVMLGAAAGLALRVYFGALHVAGETVSRVGGIAVAGSFDPGTGEESTATSRFFFWIAVLVFCAAGGLEQFADGFARLFVSAPVGSGGRPDELAGALLWSVVRSFELGFRVSAPVILAVSAAYLGMGIAGRFAPQISLLPVLFSLNVITTLAVLFIFFGVFCQVFHAETASFIEQLFDRLALR